MICGGHYSGETLHAVCAGTYLGIGHGGSDTVCCGWRFAGKAVFTYSCFAGFHRYTEGKKGWKRPLLFIQFAGVAFICGLMCVVMAQYRYVLSKDMGYNPKNLVGGELYLDKKASCDAAYQFFKGLPYVEAVSSAEGTPIYGYSGNFVYDEAGNSLFSTRFCYFMREDYPAMMGIPFKAGRMAREKGEAVVNEILRKECIGATR